LGVPFRPGFPLYLLFRDASQKDTASIPNAVCHPELVEGRSSFNDGGLIGKYSPKFVSLKGLAGQMEKVAELILICNAFKSELYIFVSNNLKSRQMKKILGLAVLFVSTIAAAQDMDVVKGDFSAISGQKEFNVEFDYSKMTLLKEKKTQAQYIEDRAKDLNDKDKGNGETWKKKWQGAKDGIWAPKFLELVNVVLHKEKKDVLFQEGLSTAKYTLIVEVVWIYPGYDVYVSKQPAKVSTNLRFVETANRSNVVL
jgi:hypothetical protein